MSRMECVHVGIRVLAGMSLLLAIGAGRAVGAEALNDAWLTVARQDAALRDVCFVDPSQGWAVGHRGVIWHTVDGGQTWQLQNSGVQATLESVHFLDAQRGWAAGGELLPYTHLSEGVLLRTVDGGRSWHRDPSLLLPALARVYFFDERQGWAIGETSPQFPTGVFITGDGGRSWSAATGMSASGWLAADFIDPQTGAVAGRQGALARFRQGILTPSRTPPLGLRGLAAMKLVAPTAGWLVGDGGLVLQTVDLGATWQQPPGEIRQSPDAPCDWHAVAALGPQCWIAGTPGSVVLHTADGGASWQSLRTGQSLPIYALEFLDPQRGWAVGALGTVLFTADGGRTWQRQRGGGSRAALLALYSEAGAVPLEMITHLAGQQGYLTAVELLARRDTEPATGETDPTLQRAEVAMLAQGASDTSMAWQFPLRQQGIQRTAEHLIDGWNMANDGHGVQRLEAYLVRQIRCWRPEVIVTHAAAPRGDDPLGHVVNQLTLRAVEQAADATRFTEQLTEMGLEPWQVKRVFGSLPAGEHGTITITTSQLAPLLGGSLAQRADQGRALLYDAYVPAPETIGFRLFVDRASGLGSKDFFTGIALTPGGEARRAQPAASPWAVEQMRELADRQRNIRAILSRADQAALDPGRFLGQIAPMTDTLDADSAATTLHQMADFYWRRGLWPQAVETLGALLERYPEHPLAPAAAQWLMQYWSSGEAARRFATDTGVQLVSFEQQTSPTAGEPLEGELPSFGEVAQQIDRAAGGLRTEPQAVDRAERAAELAKMIAARWPALYQQPELRFPLARTQWQRGYSQSAERYFLNVLNTRPDDPWRVCAAGEQWLSGPRQEAPPMALLTVKRAGEPPRLDGRLDDALWQRAKRAELHSALRDDATWPAVVMLGYDARFLYIAASCRKAPGVQYTTGEGPRPRDADLKERDRLELLIDVDRDRTTWYRLAVDHRGWPHDECWGDATWNPAWFIAAGEDEGSWTVEAAIPLAELELRPAESKTVWAVGLQRIVPGAGFQSWSKPATSTGCGQGLGCALFE